MKHGLASLFGVAAAAAVLGACIPQPRPEADRVFFNAAIYTLDTDRRRAEAVAILDGTIIHVGSNTGAEAFIGKRTRVTDLAGRMMLPGFHDAHAHVLAGGTSAAGCDLQDLRDKAAIRARLIACSEDRSYGPDEWVRGARWALAAFENGTPPMVWLDDIFDGRPAYFVDSFGHSAWVSSRALAIAGIDSETPNPQNGVIERDPTSGEANGTLRDAAMELVSGHIPPPSAEQRRLALALGLRQANAFGITAYVEPGLDETSIATYLGAERQGQLSARVVASLSPRGWDATAFGPEVFDLVRRRDEFRGSYLGVDSVKVYVDGVIETRTSYMLEPYDNGENFAPFYTQEALNDIYQRLDEMGVQVHTHAIGDGAIRQALNAYEHARDVNGPNDNRHQIVHLQLIDEADIPRFAELGIAANFQALWAYPDEYIDVALPLLGEERVNRFYPIASVQRAGGLIVGGSDWDVSSLNPLDAIEVGVRRQDPYAESGAVLNDSERVGLETMIDAYTRNAARVMRLDHLTGSIEKGKRADLIVLDRNLFEIPPTEINEAKVLLTLMDGREVYRAPDLPASESSY